MYWDLFKRSSKASRGDEASNSPHSYLTDAISFHNVDKNFGSSFPFYNWIFKDRTQWSGLDFAGIWPKPSSIAWSLDIQERKWQSKVRDQTGSTSEHQRRSQPHNWSTIHCHRLSRSRMWWYCYSDQKLYATQVAMIFVLSRHERFPFHIYLA